MYEVRSGKIKLGILRRSRLGSIFSQRIARVAYSSRHCGWRPIVSPEWGFFRQLSPYRLIGERLKLTTEGPTVGAFGRRLATKYAENDIKKPLGLTRQNAYVTAFVRPEFILLCHPYTKAHGLCSPFHVRQHDNENGIIYCALRARM